MQITHYRVSTQNKAAQILNKWTIIKFNSLKTIKSTVISQQEENNKRGKKQKTNESKGSGGPL